MIRIIAALFLFALPAATGAASLADRFAPGVLYYFESFDAGQRPWAPGQELNIEEVFKNYQYYEIMFERDGKGITVNRYARGSRADSEKYRILPDGALQEDGQ